MDRDNVPSEEIVQAPQPHDHDNIWTENIFSSIELYVPFPIYIWIRAHSYGLANMLATVFQMCSTTYFADFTIHFSVVDLTALY